MTGKPEAVNKTRFYQCVRMLVKALAAVFYPSRLVNPGILEAMNAPYIMIANHQSMMDPLLLAAHLKRYEIRFLGKRELTRFALLRWVVEKLHMIPVSRHQSDIRAMRACLNTLKEGHVLCLFPEGSRYPGSKPMTHIESGFTVLALRGRVPLLPVYIHGIPRPFRRVEMLVGDPIPFETLRRESDELSYEAVKTHIRGVYQRLEEKLKHQKNISSQRTV
ncbi:MAG: lysophospholipid acyltransferase family protein [Eubacteriales bacterium]|nr:lysophospholipid acyltransferase family protein [Eubacteriales bacterium]